MIEAAVTEKVDGLAVSAPDPDAISSAVRQAVDAGIPVITLNSGLDSYQQLGALTHVGQTEGMAGEAAGRALKENGRQEAAVRHPRAGQHRPQRPLRRRQEGLRRRRREHAGQGHQRHPDEPDRDPVQAAGGQVHRRGAGAQPRHRDRRARRGQGRELARRSWRRSTSAATSSRASRPATSCFAVDQQQYLQGYLPVQMLMLYKRNLSTIGGGQPVLTGPEPRDQGERRPRSRSSRRPVLR